jgi:hypothetical protein
MKYIFLDTETTGTDPVKNGIIQLSGIITDCNTKDGMIMGPRSEETFDLKMQPFPADVIEDLVLVAAHRRDRPGGDEAPGPSRQAARLQARHRR